MSANALAEAPSRPARASRARSRARARAPAIGRAIAYAPSLDVHGRGTTTLDAVRAHFNTSRILNMFAATSTSTTAILARARNARHARSIAARAEGAKAPAPATPAKVRMRVRRDDDERRDEERFKGIFCIRSSMSATRGRAMEGTTDVERARIG